MEARPGAAALPRPRLRRPSAILTAVLISGIASMCLAACTAFGINPITPTRAMMTGKWAHKGGAVLTLRRDGTFTGLNLPTILARLPGGSQPMDPAPGTSAGLAIFPRVSC